MNSKYNFRIFNKKSNKMILSPVSVGNGTFYVFNIDTVRRYDINDDVAVMMSTGLKDKNGKFIYECDIVKVDRDKYPDGCILDEYEKEFAIVENRIDTYGRFVLWYEPVDKDPSNIYDLVPDFYEFLKWKPTGKLDYYTLDYIEIVGNIFENKELLCQK